MTATPSNLTTLQPVQQTQSSQPITAGAPGSVDVNKLEKKHPEYVANAETWDLIKLLYCGGDQIRKNAARVLQQRAKEIPELYQERCAILTYQNILGSGI